MMRIGKRGLGMWIMSKMVLLIFLFALVFVMGSFLRIYQEKVVSDTAKSFTVLWSETANGALLYSSSSETVYLQPLIEVQGASRDYTVVLEKVEEEPMRLVFFLAWGDYKDAKEIVAQGGGFAAASVLNMPVNVEEIILFRGELDRPAFDEPRPSNQLLLTPSAAFDRRDTMLFVRNDKLFCAGSVAQAVDKPAALAALNRCCVEKWDELSECTGG
jgi:hypothetical protein